MYRIRNKNVVGALVSMMFMVPCTSSIYAANTTEGNTVVSTEVKAAYTVTIPETLEIPYGSNEAHVLMISASGVLLETDKKISVSAVGSGENGAFTMANGSETLVYEISKAALPWGAEAVNSEMTAFTGNGSKSIYDSGVKTTFFNVPVSIKLAKKKNHALVNYIFQ